MTQRSSWTAYFTLSADLLSARALVWMATFRTDGELTPDAHLYFHDRYRRLSEWHRARGHWHRARQLAMTADEHYEAAGGDDPPFAAAMAMPRPRRYTRVEAVGRPTVLGFRRPRNSA
jgi:hypothetical protein